MSATTSTTMKRVKRASESVNAAIPAWWRAALARVRAQVPTSTSNSAPSTAFGSPHVRMAVRGLAVLLAMTGALGTPLTAQRLSDEIVVCEGLFDPNTDLTFSAIYDLALDTAGRVRSVTPLHPQWEWIHQALVPCLERWRLPVQNTTVRVAVSWKWNWRSILLFQSTAMAPRLVVFGFDEGDAKSSASQSLRAPHPERWDDLFPCDALFPDVEGDEPRPSRLTYDIEADATGAVTSVSAGEGTRLLSPEAASCLRRWHFSVPNARVRITGDRSQSTGGRRLEVSIAGQPARVIVFEPSR